MVKHTQRIRRLKSGSILESKGIGVIFQKKGKEMLKRQNIWKSRQKCTKVEDILKMGRWMRAIIARNKVLEWAQKVPKIFLYNGSKNGEI